MLLRSIGALLLTLGVVNGFKDASPFLALSTRPIGKLQSAVVATGEDILGTVASEVASGSISASKQHYYIFSQPGLTAEDLDDDRVMPKMKALASQRGYEGRVEIPNVLGGLDTKAWSKELNIEREAITKGGSLPSAGEARIRALNKLDNKIATAAAESTDAHAIILFSGSASEESYDETPEHQYEMDEPYPTAMHQDLKRHLNVLPRQTGNKSTHMQDGLPLFEKYQFLTPGLFMGLTVSILLTVILWVGVSAIAGLEVSYKAFSKEMGPQAQNKGKQQQ